MFEESYIEPLFSNTGTFFMSTSATSELKAEWSQTELVCTHPDGSGGARVAVINGRDGEGRSYTNQKYLVEDEYYPSDTGPRDNIVFVHPREGFRLIAEFNTKPGKTRLADEVASPEVERKILELMETNAREKPDWGFWLTHWDSTKNQYVERRLGAGKTAPASVPH